MDLLDDLQDGNEGELVSPPTSIIFNVSILLRIFMT